jgi:8-oxo-dGTP diphosphatase
MTAKDITDYLLKAEEISKVGLMYSKDPYAIDNYKELQALTKEFLQSEGVATLEGDNFFRRPIYPTPNVSVRSIIFDEARKKVLLVQERLDGGYSLPGGWSELTLSPAQSALKEIREEAGSEAEIVRLVGVFDRYHECRTVGIPEYMIVFEAKITQELSAPCQEILSKGYFPVTELPKWSRKNNPAQMREILALALKKKTGFD